MHDDQMVFGEIFRDQVYGLRVGEPRRWHELCLIDYISRLARWKAMPHLNGDGQRLAHSIYGGTGAGKTDASAHLASYMLNSGHVGQVALVCPNDTVLEKTRWVYGSRFNIELDEFSARRHRRGIPRGVQGYITKYQNLIQDPATHRKICGPDTLAIFDEIHHLGDEAPWGQAAVEAYGRVRFSLGLTGTPWRPPGSGPIPEEFVCYEDVPDRPGFRKLRADFTYSLGDAIADGICREPVFTFFDGAVRTRFGVKSGENLVTFEDEDVGEAIASQRLAGAVHHTSPARNRMLRWALEECRREGRKVFIFLGGDSNASVTPTEDATESLPEQLRTLGYGDAFQVLTGSDRNVREKIREIGRSNKWIVVAINMLSEGVDLPEFSAAIFLSIVTAPQTTVQRIGRALRRGDGSLVTAYIYMFGDSRYKRLALDIKGEYDLAVDFRAKAEAQRGGREGEKYRRPEAMCVDGGRPTEVVVAGKPYTMDVLQAKVAEMGRLHRISPSLQDAILKLYTETTLECSAHE